MMGSYVVTDSLKLNLVELCPLAYTVGQLGVGSIVTCFIDQEAVLSREGSR